MSAVGSHIKKLRKQRGLSQQALAEMLNVTRQAVSQWEMGNAQPDIDTLERISQAFGVDIHEVIYGSRAKAAPHLTPRQRKRYRIGLIVFGAIAISVGAVSLILRHSWSSWVMWPSWYIQNYIIFWFLALPMFYISITLGALNGCSLLWDIRIRSRIIRCVLLAITIAFLLLYAGIMVIHTIFFIRLQLFTAEYPAVFLLPGIGLFFGLNGCGGSGRSDNGPGR